MDIKGHAAVVTGGASGLGAATAEELARAGAKVACLDVNLDGARAVAERIGGCAVRCDVTDGEQAAAALAQARDQHGAARILINCAGVGPAKRIVGRDGPMPLADFERVIAINLIGTFNMMRLAAADMQNLSPLADEERGVIISAASVAAFEGQIGQAAYSASKGGVAALTMPAAREFAQFGIRVNAIAPGIFHTPMLMALPEEAKKSLAAAVPFPKLLGRPDQFASLARHIIAEPTARTKRNARQQPRRPHRMGRLRPGRDRVLPALFRLFRRQHLGAARARARDDQAPLPESL
jgi:NAD(P)-dependent dehydrogenase (short-subunit alcohol dehydrogenase family)